MLGDFYLKDVWRFAAVGQGFDGGLDALLRNFGGEVVEEEAPAAPPPAAAVRRRARLRGPRLRRPAQHPSRPPRLPLRRSAPPPGRRRRPRHPRLGARRRMCTLRRPSIAPMAPPGGAPIPPRAVRTVRPAAPAAADGQPPVGQRPAAARHGQPRRRMRPGPAPRRPATVSPPPPPVTVSRPPRAGPGQPGLRRPAGRSSGRRRCQRPPSRSTRNAHGQRWTRRTRSWSGSTSASVASPSSPDRAAW